MNDLSPNIDPEIRGVGGNMSSEGKDDVLPFMVQYENRMEWFRQKLVKKDMRHRLRMIAYSSL